MKFKVGDRVKVKTREFKGVTGTISEIEKDDIYCRNWSDNPGAKQHLQTADLILISRKDKNMKAKKVNFILQYDREEDPIETFETQKEVIERITELAKDEEVQQDSYKVYEVKKSYEVKVTTTVELK